MDEEALKVSIIISNRNDVAMMSVTFRSCIEELRPLGPGGGEVVIGDNSDEPTFQLLRGALPAGYIRDGRLKIVHQKFPCLFSARELAAQTATGEYLMCLDSHMIVGRDSIVKLVDFMDRHQESDIGFAHAPISWAHQHEDRAKHDRDMTTHELGNWGTAYKDERLISWKGMPWICRRSWFLDREKGLNGYGALSKHHVSWGGGDMHIGIKPWLLGFKNWAVPTNPCVHIGPFPRIDTKGNPNVTVVSKNPEDYHYRVYSKSGEYPHTFGFLVACYILGGEAMMNRNKKALSDRFGQFLSADKWWVKAKEIGREEKIWLDSRKIMSFEQLLERKPWNDGQRDLRPMVS